MPRVASLADSTPLSSGPRWSMASHIRATLGTRRADAVVASTMPAMPHMREGRS